MSSKRRVDYGMHSWMESVTEEEVEAAELFWEDWVGEAVNPRTGSRTTGTSRSSTPSLRTMASRCVSANRGLDFRRNLAPTTIPPRAEICKILVTKRGNALPGAPVVLPSGEPNPDPPRDPNVEPGAGNLDPRRVRPFAVGLVHEVGTGFFVRPDRIVTAAHVLLDAVEVIVIPGKMGPTPPGGSGTGSGTGTGPTVSPTEPFGRLTVRPPQIVIRPQAIAALMSATATAMDFFAEDMAVIRGFGPIPPPPARAHPFGAVYRLGGRPRRDACVNTSGYSAASVDPNFQHSDRGFYTPTGGPLDEFDLQTEKGASGSPIWHGPDPMSTGAAARPRDVVGIVVMGNGPTHTGSPVLDRLRRSWLMTA